MKNNKELRNIGYQVTLGAINAIGLMVCLSYLLIGIFNLLEIGVDDSDKSGWDRSGLKIHIDNKTGKEYLSTPKGGIIER